MARRILILFAHPSVERSEINSPLAQDATEHAACTLVDLYAEYPDYRINVDREQARLTSHDVIVFLFPLFWYSTPALLKEWQDLVLEHGFAYGSGGDALKGKDFLCVCSAGGPESAYHQGGMNNFELRALLRPLEQTANLCQMSYLPPFAIFGSRTALEDGRLPLHRKQFRLLLDALAEDSLQEWRGSTARLLQLGEPANGVGLEDQS
ncbi:MAG: NAD(P)H-dependent oxidoreductase [Pseudomonadota bacterium]